MRKTICSGIITFGILVSLSSCYAFDYRSEEAGFSVDIPDDNTIIVSKDLFFDRFIYTWAKESLL